MIGKEGSARMLSILQGMNLERFLLAQLKIGVVLILFVPLLVGPFGISFSEYPKALFLRVIVEVLFFVYLLLLIKNPAYLPRLTPLLGILVAFGVIQLAAGACRPRNVRPRRSNILQVLC